MMSSDAFTGFTKENMDSYFSELGKELKKEFGRLAHFEIIIVGGGAILLNYEFRDTTQDVDFFATNRDLLKAASNRVGDKFGLPTGWLNSDFVRTKSYSAQIIGHSKYYRTFSNVLAVRTVQGAYLVAMKLASLRPYKNDLSDIVGIVQAERKRAEKFTVREIADAYLELYNKELTEDQLMVLQEAFDCEKIRYADVRKSEIENKSLLRAFEEKYDHVLTEDNLGNILSALNSKKQPNISLEKEAEEYPDLPFR